VVRRHRHARRQLPRRRGVPQLAQGPGAPPWSLPVPFDLASFGGPDLALRFDSMGFYQHDGAVVQQFMPGMPLIGAFGHSLGGLTDVLLMPPVLGGLAVLAFAGVVACLAGTLGAGMMGPAEGRISPPQRALSRRRLTGHGRRSSLLPMGGVVGHAGARLLTDLAEVTGLTVAWAQTVENRGCLPEATAGQPIPGWCSTWTPPS
jgi:hypothetical protein